MTEDEAKTKWCFRRKPDPIYVPEPSNIRCIGSACMAWRWQMTVNKDGSIEDEKEGFCGLAGEP
jgi:hypothetical protein